MALFLAAHHLISGRSCRSLQIKVCPAHTQDRLLPIGSPLSSVKIQRECGLMPASILVPYQFGLFFDFEICYRQHSASNNRNIASHRVELFADHAVHASIAFLGCLTAQNSFSAWPTNCLLASDMLQRKSHVKSTLSLSLRLPLADCSGPKGAALFNQSGWRHSEHVRNVLPTLPALLVCLACKSCSLTFGCSVTCHAKASFRAAQFHARTMEPKHRLYMTSPRPKLAT